MQQHHSHLQTQWRSPSWKQINFQFRTKHRRMWSKQVTPLYHNDRKTEKTTRIYFLSLYRLSEQGYLEQNWRRKDTGIGEAGERVTASLGGLIPSVAEGAAPTHDLHQNMKKTSITRTNCPMCHQKLGYSLISLYPEKENTETAARSSERERSIRTRPSGWQLNSGVRLAAVQLQRTAAQGRKVHRMSRLVRSYFLPNNLHCLSIINPLFCSEINVRDNKIRLFYRLVDNNPQFSCPSKSCQPYVNMT